MFAIVTVSIQALSNSQIIVDILQNLFTIAAIIVGGFWTYFNFFKGRTYKIRLEPEVFGKVVTLNGLSHLIVTMSLKNVGLSNVEIEQEASALQLLSYEVPVSTTDALSAAWEDVTAFPVFESRAGVNPGEGIDQRIEPGEVIEDERLIMVPSNERMAFQLRLRVVSKGVEWEAIDTVVPSGENGTGREGDKYGEETRTGGF